MPTTALKQTFQATIDARPGHPHNLTVKGDVEVPTTGYEVHLHRASPQGINPLDLILEVKAEGPHGPAGDIVSKLQVSYQEHPAKAEYTHLTIRDGKQSFTIPVSRLA
jgi:hypothetical protein